MLEPVTLVNIGRDFDRRSLECWRKQGVPLKGWVMLVSNEGLRCEIQAWVRSVGLDLDDLADAAYSSTDASSACADLGRGGASHDASATGRAGQGSGSRGDCHAAGAADVAAAPHLQRSRSL